VKKFYKEVMERHPETGAKIWIMDTHATRSPVPSARDTYNDIITDNSMLMLCRNVSPLTRRDCPRSA
jgi:hypothetical protein